MRFSLKKEDILRELQLLQGIVEKRNTMPILANILVIAAENQVELIGTDLEVGLKTYFPAEVSSPGAITVSGKKLFEIVRSLPEGKEVIFEQKDDHMMEIKSGASHFKVLCLPKEDYPQVPEPNFEQKILLPLEKFQSMIEKVYFAITQEQRYYLNGALMILKPQGIELVSTDGHRLAYTRLMVENLNINQEVRGIVSRKTLNELKKLENETLAFDQDENNLFFNVENRTLIARVIEGKFPNYEAVIPTGNPHILSFAREEIANAIRRVSLLSTERSKGVKFNIGHNKVELFSSNPEMGEARDEVETTFAGSEFSIGFNSQYLLEFLTTAKSERIQFEMKDESSAILMYPEDDDEMEYKYVLMPMKL